MTAKNQTEAAKQEWGRNWKVVVAASAGMSLAALSTTSFGVMVVPIEQDLGWTRTEISSGPMLITAVVFSLSTLFGNVIDRFGARKIGAAAVLVVCGALAMMSQIGASLWGWWAIWAAVGLGSAVMPTVWLKPVSTNFTAGRGLALALVLCGSGVSSFIVPNLANRLVDDYGWRLAYLALAGIWCAIVLPLVLLFLHSKPQGGPEGANATDEASDAASLGLTPREGFAFPKFYRLLIAVWCSTFFGTAIVLNLVPVLRSTGLAAVSAASIAGLMGFSIVGRFASGWLLDRFNASHIAAIASLIMLLLPGLLLLMPGSVPAAIAAVIAFSLMGGALLPSIAYLVSRHMGARSFGTFYGTINAVNAIGVGLGPLLANYLYDRTGSYRPTMLAALPLFAIGAALFLTLGRYPEFSAPDQGNDKVPRI
jgi:MFS family permease